MVRSSGFVPDPSWGGGGGRGAGAGGYGTRSVGGPWAAAAVERMCGRRRWGNGVSLGQRRQDGVAGGRGMGGDSGGTGRRRTGGAGGGGGGTETAGSRRRLEENCNRISSWWDVVLVQNKNGLISCFQLHPPTPTPPISRKLRGCRTGAQFLHPPRTNQRLPTWPHAFFNRTWPHAPSNSSSPSFFNFYNAISGTTYEIQCFWVMCVHGKLEVIIHERIFRSWINKPVKQI
jgi:hypothetical protein